MENNFTRVTCPPYVLEVDVERTRAFYASSRPTHLGCTCPGCQNFSRACAKAPAEGFDFLRSLGIDPERPCEACSIKGELEEDGTILYDSAYHVVGRIVEQPDPEGEVPPLDFGKTRMYIFDIGEYSMPLEKDFPHPAFEVNALVYLPYLLTTPFG